ncbi:universal stress protein [Streptomyces sp. YIM 98790]|uniref:universal stress protein n=1 Tax=Streptomyces sp. YIM 98790 TaxID=2689077 RepID=UPI001408DCE5|nr:universal stress protein [Streptomyces sp. YIM 98790]
MAVHPRTPRRILVATDLSTAASFAVQRAHALASRHAAQLYAVTVITPEEEPVSAYLASARLSAHLDQHAPRAQVLARVIHGGSVAADVAARARETHADLVVTGAPRAPGPARALRRSVPEHLARVARLPVLAVRTPPAFDYRRVLLALDATPASLQAARAGTALTPGAEHLAVHVSTIPGEHLLRMRLLAGLRPRSTGQEKHLAEKELAEKELSGLRRTRVEQVRPVIERQAQHLQPPPARTLVATGSPWEELPALAGRYGADLAALGTGGRSRTGYALLGSVARQMLRHAPCDVLLFPAGPGP